MSRKGRDYKEVVGRITRLDQNFKVHKIGEVVYDKKYPLYCVIAERGREQPSILISGEVHGDEIAGVYAVLEFLEKHTRNYENRFRFFVYPCINPSGFEAGTLKTAGLNLNRLFGVHHESEIEIIQRFLREGPCPAEYLFTMDFHEVDPDYEGEGFTKKDNPKECFIYETQKNKARRIGKKMLSELPPNTPICTWDKIYNDINSEGVIWYPEGCENEIYAQGTSFDSYLQRHFTNHSFTTETPTNWSLEKRVQTHLSFLFSALKHLKSK